MHTNNTAPITMENNLNIKFITGRSNPKLASLISSHLSVPITKCTLDDFGNGEIKVEIDEPIRNYDIYILQTGASDTDHSINDYLVELFAIVNACKLSSAKSISVVLPCYPYARSDKKDGSRVPINAAMVTTILESLGVHRIISLDLHSGQIQGFARIPFDNLYGIKLLINTIITDIIKDTSKDNFILVSPDAGGFKRVEAYAKKLTMKFVTMHKQRDYTKKSTVISSLLIGDTNIGGKTAIIVDDIVDTMGTMVSAANELHTHGVTEVYVVATHGVFSGPAIDRINNCGTIKKVFITNTISQDNNIKKTDKLVVVDTSELFGDAIKRLIYGKSIAELFV
jgi:ribose-phosphate pyrophosphokinase